MGLFMCFNRRQRHHMAPASLPHQHSRSAPPVPSPSHPTATKPSARNNLLQPPSSPLPSDNPPPYHDWASVPDTALLPPPPSIAHKTSKNNATWQEATRAHAFCDRSPPYTPAHPSPAVLTAVRNGDIVLERPHEFRGDLRPVNGEGPGLWSTKSRKGCSDCILLSMTPLYFAAIDSPLRTQQPKTIYFEVHIIGLGRGKTGITIGYCARPYPTWRLPGWERASLGVHGDDGRRFVNDMWGGKDFTTEFVEGETLGIGMEFSVPPVGASAPNGSALKAHAEVFFTRHGKRDGGWMVEEELDQDDLSGGPQGLSGELDLYAAVGLFGDVEFKVAFSPQQWMFQSRM